MNSVYLKNCLFLAGMVLLSFLVFMISFAIIIRGQTIREQQAGLEANTDAIVQMYNLFQNFNPNQEHDQEMVRYLTEIVALPQNQLIVADSRGVVIACSEHNGIICEHLGRVIPDDLRSTLNTQGVFSGVTVISGLVEGLSYVHAQPIWGYLSNSHGGYVLAASSADAVMAAWGAMVSMFLLVAASVLLMAIVLAMIVARHQAAPLKEMSLAASKFAQGEFGIRVANSGREDEIGELALAFNAMADHLEQSENMRRDFVGNVSHELKTPMTSITGFAQGMLDGTIPPEKHRDYLEIVADETRRLSRLVGRMLEVSHFQSLDIREIQSSTFDMSEVIRRGLLGVESKITSRSLDVRLHLPQDPVMVLGDPDSIMQVMYNLLDNAAKFAYTGTTIEIGLVRKSGKAQITVKNQGDVIPSEQLPLIFNRFHKNDKARSGDKDGIGLGLYIVKTIINAHREEIFVRSDKGVTEFMFTLSLAPKKKKQDKTPEPK